MLISNRGTGRTQRMLEESIARAREVDPSRVYVVCATRAQTRDLKRRAEEMDAPKNLFFTHIESRDLDSIGLRILGVPEENTFFDHYALERIKLR